MRKTLPTILCVVSLLVLPSTAGSHYQASWMRSEASWYGPGFYGHRTSCGQTLTTRSIWVAALKSQYGHCGAKVTICYRHRCQRVRVLDRGAWRSDNRAWDLTSRLRYKLRMPGTGIVKWRSGWR